MRIGSLVEWKWGLRRENESVGNVGVIVEDCGNKVYVQWANLCFRQLIYKDYLEVICK